MNKKLRLISALLLAGGIFFSAFAVSNTDAIEYFKSDQFDRAKLLLIKNLNTDANQAETNYYLGEVYLKENKLDSARIYFQKGLQANAEYIYNTIGLEKSKLKSDANAVNNLEKISKDKLYKKDVNVQLTIAKALYENGMDYVPYLEKAIKIDKKYAPLSVFEGDLAAEKKDIGNAAGKYQQAILFNPDCIEAYVKYANIYFKINNNLSIQMLQQLLEKAPTSAIGQRELAEVYYTDGKFGKAVETYATYIKNPNHFRTDLPRYATLLFFNKEFQQSLDLANQTLQNDPNNFVMQRLKMYNLAELKQYPAALATAETFMNLPNNPKYITQDYLFYGNILRENNKKELVPAQFEKALSLDSTKVELYTELSDAYENLNNYDKAIEYFLKYMNQNKENVTIKDYFKLGRMYYTAGSDAKGDTPDHLAKKNKYFVSADSAFVIIAEKTPDSYIGSFWRARANAGLDPETTKGLAKPYYEETVKIILATPDKIEDYKRQLAEAYKYLGYYYYLQFYNEKGAAAKTQSKAEAIKYWEELSKIMPSDDIKGALDALKKAN